MSPEVRLRKHPIW